MGRGSGAAEIDAGIFQSRGGDGRNVRGAEAVTAGFFDRVAPASELETAANQTAEALTKIDMPSHTETKMRVREPAIKAIRAAIDADITMAYAEQRVAARSAKA